MEKRRPHGVVVLLLSAILLSSVAGCGLLSAEPQAMGPAQAFEVHLQNNFDNDLVRVEIDHRIVFNERVTTDYIWSLADIMELAEPAGSHHVRVVVNNSVVGEQSFDLDGELCIYVKYYQEAIPHLGIPRGIMIEVSRHRILYD